MNWNDLKYFLAVARAGSLSGAAEALETTASTASRRIDALEAAIKTRLFVRLPGGYHLTDEGARLLPRIWLFTLSRRHCRSFGSNTRTSPWS